MIKAILNIILSLLIILTSVNVSISKHYCKDNLISTSLIIKAESCCGNNSNCCHDEKITIKKTDKTTISDKISIKNFTFEINNFILSNIYINEVNNLINKASLKNNSPPLSTNQLIKFICVFLL